MSNFELIDNYLTNRLSETEKISFEQEVNTDASLKASVELQRHIIESVKKARIAELKGMLNNVPVGGTGFGTAKMAASIITAALIGTALYFYLQPKTEASIISENNNQITKPVAVQPLVTLPDEQGNIESANSTSISETKKEKALGVATLKKTTVPNTNVAKPKIDALDPTSELIDNKETGNISKSEVAKSDVTLSSIEVENEFSNKKFNFHYQFAKGKLMLYGSFDKSLYEILEINGEQHAVFLFYKENYYLLNEKQNKITALAPIKDGALLKKLKEYRNR